MFNRKETLLLDIWGERESKTGHIFLWEQIAEDSRLYIHFLPQMVNA